MSLVNTVGETMFEVGDACHVDCYKILDVAIPWFSGTTEATTLCG